MVILGSNIIIPCTVHDLNDTFHSNSTFYLYKIGYENETQAVKPDNDTAMFPINNAMEKHGGKYICSYKPQPVSLMSETSDPLEILLLGEDPNLTSFRVTKMEK